MRAANRKIASGDLMERETSFEAPSTKQSVEFIYRVELMGLPALSRRELPRAVAPVQLDGGGYHPVSGTGRSPAPQAQ